MRSFIVLVSFLWWYDASACCVWYGEPTQYGMTVSAPRIMQVGQTYTVSAKAWASGSCTLTCGQGCGPSGVLTAGAISVTTGASTTYCGNEAQVCTTTGTHTYNWNNVGAYYGDASAVIGSTGLAPTGCDVPHPDPYERYYYTVTGAPLNTGTPNCQQSVGGSAGGGSAGGGSAGGGPAGLIDVTTGNASTVRRDYGRPGPGELTLTRTYQNQVATAKNAVRGLFGLGVSTEYDERVGLLSPSQDPAPPLVFRGGDGAIAYYQQTIANPSVYGGYLQAGRSTVTVKVDGYVRDDGEGGTRTFDVAGKLLKISPRNGATRTLTYASGKLARVTDRFGNYLAFSYDAGCPAQVGTVSDATGVVATYTYMDWPAPACSLATVTLADGTGYTFDYVPWGGGAGSVSTVKDKVGNLLEGYTYDSRGRVLTSQRAGGAGVVTLVYTTPDQTDVTDGDGNVTTFWYEKLSNGLNVVTRVLGKSSCGTSDQGEEWSYDALGNVVSHTNGLGQTEILDYNQNSCLVKVTDALLNVTAFTVDQFCNVLSATDANGHTVSSVLDAEGNATSYTTPTGDTYTVTYGSGSPTSVKNPRGKITTYAYTAAGDVAKVTFPLLNGVTFTRNARGAALTAATTKVGTQANTTTWTRDQVNRPLTLKTPRAAVYTNTFTNGLLTAQKDPLARTVNWSWDAARRVAGFTDALGATTIAEYSLLDEISKVGGYSFASDGHGRARKVTWPDGTFDASVRDGAGRLTSRTDRRGITTTFDRDALGRAKTISYSDGTPAVALAYDPAGNLLSAASSIDALTFTYDAADRLVSESSLRNQSTLGYSYDANGNLSLITLNGAAFASFTYDDDDRLKTIVRSGATYSFTYDAAGRLSTMTYPNGVVTTVAYSADNQPTSIVAKKGTATRMSALYTVDLAGNVTRKTLPEYVENYTVDANDQVLTAKRGTTVVGSYSWDAAGNPTMAGWSVDGNNRLLATPTAVLGYDAAGNLITRVTGGVTWGYTWDALNRMTSVTRDGTVVATFAYDPFGRRVEKKMGATTTKYTYAGSLLFREATGAKVLQYVNFGQLMAVEEGAAVTYLHADALGSIVKGTNASGAVAWTRTYSVFGVLTGNVTSGPAFTGHYYDSETGLYNSPARTYDPVLGRFLSEDPSLFDDGFNLYRYARNRPQSMYDPTGLKPTERGVLSALSMEELSIRQGHRTELMTYDELVQLAEMNDESQEIIDGMVTMGLGNIQASRAIGISGEVQACIDIGSKKSIIGPITKKLRRPDELLQVAKWLREVKNVKYQTFTKQIQDYLAYAEREFGHGRMKMDIRAGDGTRLAKRLQEMEDTGRIIFRRYLDKCCK